MHGGIDGFLQNLFFLRCAMNNGVDTVKDCFVRGVQEFELPLRVRCHIEGENVDVAQFLWSQPNWSQEFGNVNRKKSVHE